MAIDHNVIVSKTNVFLELLNERLLDLVPGISGASYDYITNQAFVHFVVSDTSNDALAQSIVEAHNTLTVNPDKASIFANGTDTVELSTVVDNGATIEVTTHRNGEVYMSATQTPYPDVGLHKCQLNTPTKGKYLIEIADVNSHATGYIEIPAV